MFECSLSVREKVALALTYTLGLVLRENRWDLLFAFFKSVVRKDTKHRPFYSSGSGRGGKDNKKKKRSAKPVFWKQKIINRTDRWLNGEHVALFQEACDAYDPNNFKASKANQESRPNAKSRSKTRYQADPSKVELAAKSKRIVDLVVKDGLVGKAAQMLLGTESVLPPCESRLGQMEQLHPSPQEAELKKPAPLPCDALGLNSRSVIVASVDDVSAALTSFARGAAGGPTGGRPQI